MLARNLPGIGNPMKLDIRSFFRYLDSMVRVLRIERGGMSPREWVEMEAARRG